MPSSGFFMRVPQETTAKAVPSSEKKRAFQNTHLIPLV